MGNMDMSLEMAMPRMQMWSVLDLMLLFIMWAVMMVAMMVPTAASMLLIFAKIQRQRRAQERPLVEVHAKDTTSAISAGFLRKQPALLAGLARAGRFSLSFSIT
jgi:predicted metal-binding membrane protein